MNKIAVFPGSFDPVTKGHENLIIRALPLFNKIVIAVGTNIEKKSFFSLDKRIYFLQKAFQAYPNIEVDNYSGLTVDYCKKIGAKYILRGLRSFADFEFERKIAQMNKKLNPEIETIFLLTLPDFTPLSSSIVRDILRCGGDVRQFVPESIAEDIMNSI